MWIALCVVLVDGSIRAFVFVRLQDCEMIHHSGPAIRIVVPFLSRPVSRYGRGCHRYHLSVFFFLHETTPNTKICNISYRHTHGLPYEGFPVTTPSLSLWVLFCFTHCCRKSELHSRRARQFFVPATTAGRLRRAPKIVDGAHGRKVDTNLRF
jgi:hypothetical protein